MARADGALFRTAETVPAARPTCSATSLSVTLPGWLRPDFFFFPISRDYRRRFMIHTHLNSRIAPNKAIGYPGACRLALAHARVVTGSAPSCGAKPHHHMLRSAPTITFQPALPNPRGTHRLYSAPSAIAATGPHPP